MSYATLSLSSAPTPSLGNPTRGDHTPTNKTPLPRGVLLIQNPSLISDINLGYMDNRLHNLEEFKKLLRGYHISAHGQKLLSRSKLALLAAPTSSGRNTIIRELLKTGYYHYLVSDTTRLPRINDGIEERNGVEYWFREEEDVLSDLKAGKYLEAAVIHDQQVSGISLREIKAAQDESKIAITDIEMVGVETIVKAKPDAMVFFVVPPDYSEWQRRIKHRGHMTREEHRRRMESALAEFAHALEHKYYNFIINDTVDNALEQIHLRAVLGFKDLITQIRGRNIVEHLYLETQKHLKG